MTWYKSVFLFLIISVGCSDNSESERNHLDSYEIELIRTLQFRCFKDCEEQVMEYMQIMEKADDSSNPVQSEGQELSAMLKQLDSSSLLCMKTLNDAQKELIKNYCLNVDTSRLIENINDFEDFARISTDFNRFTKFRKLNDVSLKNQMIHQLERAFKSYRDKHFKLLSHAAGVASESKQVSRSFKDRVRQYKKTKKITCIYQPYSALCFSIDIILIDLPNFDYRNQRTGADKMSFSTLYCYLLSLQDEIMRTRQDVLELFNSSIEYHYRMSLE